MLKKVNLGSELYLLTKCGMRANFLVSLAEAILVSNVPVTMDQNGPGGCVRNSDLFWPYSVNSYRHFKHCFCLSVCEQSPRESAKCDPDGLDLALTPLSWTLVSTSVFETQLHPTNLWTKCHAGYTLGIRIHIDQNILEISGEKWNSTKIPHYLGSKLYSRDHTLCLELIFL